MPRSQSQRNANFRFSGLSLCVSAPLRETIPSHKSHQWDARKIAYAA